MQTEKRYLTIRETAAAMGIPMHRVRTWVNTGTAPGFHAGTRFYVDRVELQKKLDEGRMDERNRQ
jgi:hypothetical protein